MITCTRRIQFCAGHRVMEHESKCAHLHGHNYVAFITARADELESPLDDVGRVIDFSVIKDIIGRWIDVHWDHGFILYREDEAGRTALKTFGSECHRLGQKPKHQKIYLLPYNPTAENMARYLLTVVCPHQFLSHSITVTKVLVWETENCYAEVTLEGV